MGSTIFGATLAMALAAGPLLSAPVDRTPPPDVGAGRVAWFDVTTTDIARSKDFYAKLFDWQFAALPGTDQAVEIVAKGASIGTIRGADGKISPFNGVVYVQVDDIRAACAKAKELGGTIPPGFPFNLSDGAGAIAILTDPTGHPIGLYSKTPLPAAPPKK
jgi:hypothetical protein